MSPELLTALLGGGGLGAIAAAVVAGLFSRRKLGAEATEIITKAASGVVERLEAELARVTNERGAMRDELEQVRREWTAERLVWRQVLTIHAAWDTLAIGKLTECGVVIQAPPPLYPPTDP